MHNGCHSPSCTEFHLGISPGGGGGGVDLSKKAMMHRIHVSFNLLLFFFLNHKPNTYLSFTVSFLCQNVQRGSSAFRRGGGGG